MRLFRLLIWDALYCMILTVSYFASTMLPTASAQYLVTALTCAACGAFLSQLPQQSGALALILVTLPGLYLALAPFLSPGFTMLTGILPFSMPFRLVPAILLSQQTEALRFAGALAAGYTIFRHKAK